MTWMVVGARFSNTHYQSNSQMCNKLNFFEAFLEKLVLQHQLTISQYGFFKPINVTHVKPLLLESSFMFSGLIEKDQ